MSTESSDARLERIREAIERQAFVRSTDAHIVSRKGEIKEKGWLFDFRNILLEADIVEDLATLFWERFRSERPIQIGCIESAGIPLAAALVAHGKANGQREVSGFYIRKSRKKDGLTKMIEGTIKDNADIILVDDLINSGKSFMRQIEVVKAAEHEVHAFWSIIRFRNEEYYQSLTGAADIKKYSLFSLDDFTDALGVKNLITDEPKPRRPLKILWHFASKDPGYFHVVSKSDPVIDDKSIYVGSDSGIFWALDQMTGNVVWSYKVGFHPKGKGIFSSPALHDGIVYFGAYDGNVYALDAKTGKRKWIFYEADWIGSSPALAPDLGLLFIGLEFGLFKKRGGIVAIDMKSGKKVWDYRMPCFTHSSPLYIREKEQVVIGSNDGVAYLFDARSGDLQWKFSTGQLTEEELNTGFSSYDIKESFAYDATHDRILFGNKIGKVFSVDRKSGKEIASFAAEFGFYSTPVVYKSTVLVSSLDKRLYCLDLDTLREKWRWNAGARIFATPTIIEGSVWIGANTGRLTELDPETGAERSYLTLTERITNRVAYNPKTKHFFVPTFANELYCIEAVPRQAT
ncbi:MAG TPA: PQQ-binding-like beta-propeller repeat protein [Candidatus Paceibacterota bacterium]